MASLLPYQQIRTNTVNFFMRNTGRTLWKTITSVSKAGMKKGRKTTRQPVRPLEQFYRIGASPLKIKYPGLNEAIRFDDPTALEPMSIEEQTEEEYKEGVDMIHDRLEAKGKTKKRRQREKLHPLERGFSGHKIEGQKLGPMPPLDGVNFDDFQSYVLEIKRTANMTRVFGRVHTMAALVFVGNGNGLAGYAVGKAGLNRSMNAVIKGMKIASRKLFYVDLLEGRTIYQDFYAECRNTRIFAQRRPKGFGLICHPRLQKICEAIGIKDIYIKVEGSTRNYLALTHAFVTGLQNQETHQQLADRKGLHVVELDPTRNYFPKIVASPIGTELKTDEDLLPIDKLNLDDFYGEGRQPLHKEKPKPFYANLPGHLLAEWRKHPFRNMDQVQTRLMADGFVERWTRDNRHEYSARWNEKALNGVVPIPQGIGLTAVIPKSEE
ncbi:unnamed protein product [Bursaphelenchus okinawaensis]|uniref:Small ribosomal subunit protein uS5m n=1 Tax=Bursaphelenchus okinawaensis TaxID=465554 RepID=A0A811LF60_9BILA|nr:unnamed protein product [Bursaphelenchus okinawaensis]CAG9121170.1 unnamed protein product [Bursaphelenchus okinawaensis]